MSIVRVKKTENFSVLRNDMLRNTKLTWEARGLLAYLLSKPDNWQVSMEDLSQASRSQGVIVLRRVVKELMDTGYIKRQRVNNSNGTFDWLSEIYEEPYGGFTPMDNPPMQNMEIKEELIEQRNTDKSKKSSSESASPSSLTLTPPPDKETRHQATIDNFFAAFCRVNQVQDMPNMKAFTANLKAFLRDHPARSYPQQRIDICIANWEASHPKWHTFAQPWTIILHLEKFSKGALDEFSTQIGVRTNGRPEGTAQKRTARNLETVKRVIGGIREKAGANSALTSGDGGSDVGGDAE